MTTYAIDRRGFGGSGDRDGYAIEQEFRDVAAVSTRRRPQRVRRPLGDSDRAGGAIGAAALPGTVPPDPVRPQWGSPIRRDGSTPSRKLWRRRCRRSDSRRPGRHPRDDRRGRRGATIDATVGGLSGRGADGFARRDGERLGVRPGAFDGVLASTRSWSGPRRACADAIHAASCSGDPGRPHACAWRAWTPGLHHRSRLIASIITQFVGCSTYSRAPAAPVYRGEAGSAVRDFPS